MKTGLVPGMLHAGVESAHQTQLPLVVRTSSRPAASVTTISRPLGEKEASAARCPHLCGASHTRRARPVWAEARITPLPDSGVTASCPLAPGNAAEAGAADAASPRTVAANVIHRILMPMHTKT